MQSKTGLFIKFIDKSIPSFHKRVLYNSKSKIYAKLLCQLRTSISRLNGYLYKILAAKFGQCSCNTGKKTIYHFFFCYPLWDKF